MVKLQTKKLKEHNRRFEFDEVINISKQDIKVLDNSVFVGSWNYIKPNMKPNKDGEIELVLQLCFGPLEWWKWSIDKQGRFWVEYKWCENDFYEDENFVEECSQEKMIEKMQQMQNFFADCGLDEYVDAYERAEQFVKQQQR